MATIHKDPLPSSSATIRPASPVYRRISRSQNLHLEITSSVIPQSVVLPLLKQNANANTNTPAMIDRHADMNININSNINIPYSNSSTRSDTSASSRSSTPTRSTASSTATDDGSSIATPTIETSSPIPSLGGGAQTLTLPSPQDDATRLLLRDRYLDSLQRPIIVGSGGIPRSVYQDSKSAAALLDIFTPPETPASAGKSKEKTNPLLDRSLPPPKFQLGHQNPRQRPDTSEGPPLRPSADWSDMGIDNRVLREDEEAEDEVDGVLQPLGIYELDNAKKPTRLGSGAWSNVYKGVLYPKGSDDRPLVIAIKRPLNNFSIPALKREAMVLSHIHRKVYSSDTYKTHSLIPFHGFDASTTSILMTALSGDNLEQFTGRCRSSSPRNAANFNWLKLPAVGITQWLFIAERLISAFAFLKAAGVIHGDVKPQNILTKAFDKGLFGDPKYDWISDEEAAGLVEPVVADFSSSYVVDTHGNIADEEEAINAVTTIYCAPELLAAFLTPPTTPTKAVPAISSTSPRPLPTFSSDHYGLCMTLLQCAIGSHPYSAAKMDIQRNIWVRQGDPMAFARADERGFRCKAGGAVDRLLRGCFGKTAEGRVGVEELVGRVEGLCGEWAGRKGEEAWVWTAPRNMK